MKGAEETGQGEIMLVPLAKTTAELKGRVSGSQKPPFQSLQTYPGISLGQ